VTAPVLAGPAAQDQSLGLELVQQADQIGAVDLQLGRQLLLPGDAAIGAQHGERDQVTGPQPERLQLRLRAHPDQPGQMAQ
jgi:hypothetical protein